MKVVFTVDLDTKQDDVEYFTKLFDILPKKEQDHRSVAHDIVQLDTSIRIYKENYDKNVKLLESLESSTIDLFEYWLDLDREEYFITYTRIYNLLVNTGSVMVDAPSIVKEITKVSNENKDFKEFKSLEYSKIRVAEQAEAVRQDPMSFDPHAVPVDGGSNIAIFDLDETLVTQTATYSAEQLKFTISETGNNKFKDYLGLPRDKELGPNVGYEIFNKISFDNYNCIVLNQLNENATFLQFMNILNIIDDKEKENIRKVLFLPF